MYNGTSPIIPGKTAHGNFGASAQQRKIDSFFKRDSIIMFTASAVSMP
jgi:hypothetical protein